MKMEGNLRFVCACLCALFTAGFSGPAEYDLQQYCNATIDTFSSVLLNINGGWWAANDKCTVRIRATHGGVDQVRLEVLNLTTPCQTLWITLQDGPYSRDNSFRPTTRPMSPMLCEDGRQLQTMYLTTTDVLTLTITHNSTARLDPDDDFNVQLLATSLSISYNEGDFKCDNTFNVEDNLECDSYNNCGDWSDESHRHCHHHYWRRHAGIIAGSCAAGVVIIIVVVIVIVRRRRRRQTMSSERASTRQTMCQAGSPPYASLQ